MRLHGGFLPYKGRNVGTYTKKTMTTNFWGNWQASDEVETLLQALELYTAVGMAARNYAELTRLNYVSDLVQLFEYLENRGVSTVVAIDLTDLESY